MKIPGPDHPISIEPSAERLRARLLDAPHVILADSTEALLLSEAGYPPVVYFPRPG